jgi:hypothetical protein
MSSVRKPTAQEEIKWEFRGDAKFEAVNSIGHHPITAIFSGRIDCPHDLETLLELKRS